MIYSLESLVTHSFPLVFLFLLNLLLQQDRNQVFFTYCKHYIYSVVVTELNSSHMVWLYQKWIFIHGMCMPKLMASRSSKIGYLLCISDNLVNRWQMWCSDESNYVWSTKFDRSKPKIGCSSLITIRWRRLSSFDVRKIMFEFLRCLIK